MYLIPCPIAEGDIYGVLPAPNGDIIRSLDCFIVENLRSARRFLSAAGIGRPIDSLFFSECNEHTSPGDASLLINPLLEGRSVGLISEAGVPGVADPGAEVVAACHSRGVRVVPLVGPSSILLALMASGQNGQSFAFNGYLPVKPPERTKAIRRLEQRAVSEGQSQIFIEAPYRNAKLFEDILSACRPETMLTVAADITGPEEFIRTMPVSVWRSSQRPEINKRPAIFIIGSAGTSCRNSV